MRLPTGIVEAVIWIVCLVVLAIVIVFLFNGVVLPTLKQVT
jgi:hypothetical protein